MSTVGKKISFWSDEDSRVSRVRRDDNEGIPIVGYRGLGVDRSWPGDDVFPFVKDPPESSELVDYLEEQALAELPATPTFLNYTQGPVIDVGGVVALSLWVCYTESAESNVGGLSIIPVARHTPIQGQAAIQFPVGVIDSTLSIPGTITGLAARDVFQTELKWDAGAQQSPPPTVTGENCLVVNFDVAPYNEFQFLLGAFDAGIRARAWVGALR